MKHATPLLAVLMVSACQFMQSDDPSLLSFRAPAGSTLALNKTVAIPAGSTHIMIQAGRLPTESKRNQYDVACRLNFREFPQAGDNNGK